MAILKHEQDKVGDFQKRVLLHIPIGLVIGLSWLAHYILPIVLVWLFVRYEENEDIHTLDQAWKDYFGAIAGVVIATVGIIIVGVI